MSTKKAPRKISVRVATTEGEISVWRQRGFTTPAQARSAILRACRGGEAALTLPRPSADGEAVSWPLLFTSEEVAVIDACRGLVTRPRWLADVIGRSENPDEVLARELRAARRAG